METTLYVPRWQRSNLNLICTSFSKLTPPTDFCVWMQFYEGTCLMCVNKSVIFLRDNSCIDVQYVLEVQLHRYLLPTFRTFKTILCNDFLKHFLHTNMMQLFAFYNLLVSLTNFFSAFYKLNQIGKRPNFFQTEILLSTFLKIKPVGFCIYFVWK